MELRLDDALSLDDKYRLLMKQLKEKLEAGNGENKLEEVDYLN